RVDLEEVGGRRLVRDVLVDTHDDARPVLDLPLVPVRRVLDLTLHERNGKDRPTELLDLPDVAAGGLLDLVRHSLDRKRAPAGIDDVGAARAAGQVLPGREREAAA